MADKQLKNALSPSDLKDLAKLATLPEWETLCRLMDNRVIRDKNAIVVRLQKIVDVSSNEFIPTDFNPSISDLEV